MDRATTAGTSTACSGIARIAPTTGPSTKVASVPGIDPMRPRKQRTPLRDDAQLQPESGYPSGRLPTKPSAHPRPDADDDSATRRGAGSEAEFGKLNG